MADIFPVNVRIRLLTLVLLTANVTYCDAGALDLSLLFVAGVAAYVRVVTVRITLVNDWISFIPALLFANFIYFSSLYFSNYSVDYLYLLKNSVFTFIFYPALWILFSILLNLMKS